MSCACCGGGMNQHNGQVAAAETWSQTLIAGEQSDITSPVITSGTGMLWADATPVTRVSMDLIGNNFNISSFDAAGALVAATVIATLTSAWSFPDDITLDSAAPTLSIGDGTGSPSLILSKADAVNSNIFNLRVGASPRWIWQFTTGEDVQILRRDIAGAAVDTPMKFEFTDGSLIFQNDLLLDGTGAGGTGEISMAGNLILDSADPVATFGDDLGGPEIILTKAAADVSLITWSSATFTRWEFEVDASEDMLFNRFDAAGVFVDIPISIAAADGNVTLINGISIADGVFTDAPTGANDFVLGQVGDGDRGLTIFSAGDSMLAFTNTSGAIPDASMRWDDVASELIISAVGTDRLTMTATEIVATTDVGYSVGLVGNRFLRGFIQSLKTNFRGTAVTTTLGDDDYLACDTSGGGYVVNLPAAADGGATYWLEVTTGLGADVTLTRAGADTINTALTTIALAQGLHFIKSNPGGTNWRVWTMVSGVP